MLILKKKEILFMVILSTTLLNKFKHSFTRRYYRLILCNSIMKIAVFLKIIWLIKTVMKITQNKDAVV